MVKYLSLVAVLLITITACNSQKTQTDSDKVNESTPSETPPTELNSLDQTQNTEVDTLKYCVSSNHIGLGEYDPVSYFNNDAPVKGISKFISTYEGVEYFFKNEVNRDEFEKNPSKYLPQFGGWCSMTLAMGRATTPVYTNFLVDSAGRLFLFERTLSLDGKELWKENPIVNEERALQNYNRYVESGEL
ncbi:MAG: YHS domain-containing (seleno)protein [Bacteroidota bacterium]